MDDRFGRILVIHAPVAVIVAPLGGRVGGSTGVGSIRVVHSLETGALREHVNHVNLLRMEPIVNQASEPRRPGRTELRALMSPTHSVYMDRRDFADLRKRCGAVSRGLADHAVFTHLTSAALRGWQLPEGVDIPIIAVTDKEAPHHDRRGAYLRRCDIPEQDRVKWLGVQVASAEWTIVELAEDLSFLDLVATIDSALHLKQCTLESLWEAVIPGRRGVRTLRRALGFVDERSESWWESMLRLLHELCDVPVEPQKVVMNGRGDLIGRFDLWIKRTNRYPEYDGEYHRDASQHRLDLGREKGASRIGIERYGYTAKEMRFNAVRILRDADDALGRRHEVSRLKWWLEAAEHSTLTAGGRKRLAGRLRRFDRGTYPRRRKPPPDRRVAHG